MCEDTHSAIITRVWMLAKYKRVWMLAKYKPARAETKHLYKHRTRAAITLV